MYLKKLIMLMIYSEQALGRPRVCWRHVGDSPDSKHNASESNWNALKSWPWR